MRFRWNQTLLSNFILANARGHSKDQRTLAQAGVFFSVAHPDNAVTLFSRFGGYGNIVD